MINKFEGLVMPEYTADRKTVTLDPITPQETCDEILGMIKHLVLFCRMIDGNIRGNVLEFPREVDAERFALCVKKSIESQQVPGELKSV